MRKLKWMAGMGALALALSLTWLTPAKSSTQHQFSVFDVNGPFERVIDVGSEDFGSGDYILQHHPLLDPATGDRVGRAVTKVTIVRSTPDGDALFIIDCTLKLHGGDVVFYGASRFSDVAAGDVFPVVGGTGAYEAAEGHLTMQFDQVGSQSGTRIDLDFSTP